MLRAPHWRLAVARLLPLLLVWSSSLPWFVHAAAPGSALAEICTAGGLLPLRPDAADTADSSRQGAVVDSLCLLCLAACQAWDAARLAGGGPSALPGVLARIPGPCSHLPTATRRNPPPRGPPAPV